MDETGERRGDVLVRDGRIVAVEDAIDAPKGATVLDAEAASSRPGSSTCTPTCASPVGK